MLGYHSRKLYLVYYTYISIIRVRGRSSSGIPIPKPIWDDRLRLELKLGPRALPSLVHRPSYKE
jgi:hypothetical protein